MLYKDFIAISKALGVSIEYLLSLEKEEARTLLAEFLITSINGYRKGIRTDSLKIDCYLDELNSSINAAEVEHMITSGMANRLRKRYFYGEDDD